MYEIGTDDVVVAASTVAAACALFRCSQAYVGLYLMFRHRRDRLRWDASMIIAFPEPFLLAGAAIWLLATSSGEGDAVAAARASAGAALSVGGVCVFVWSLLSYRTVGTGHYVDEDHRLSTAGAYAFVRHPLYLAAILVWLGLGTAFGNAVTLGIALAYVVPAYVYYAWSEERMMVGVFGDDYRAYRKSVPMLVPWTKRP